jgi:DNA-binding CsgD family transcriptional regulator
MGLLEGSRVALMDIEVGSDRLLAIAHQGHDPANAKLYAEHYFAVDPTRATCLTAPALKATTVYEEFPKSVRAKNEYFDFAARICDIGDVVGVATAEVHGRRSTLSLQRAVDAPGYSATEKQLIELIAPHIGLAKRVQLKLGEAWSAKSELEAALGHLAMAAFVVDGQGRIRHLNAAASALLANHPHVAVRHGKLSFADSKLNPAFQAALLAAACELGRSAALPLRLGPDETAEILVAPLQPEHALASAWEAPLAFVVVARAARDQQSIARRMQQLYQLTPKESEIAALLAIGQTLEEIATGNRVSEATVRTQLRAIFAKTGTSRQAGLVRLALSGAALKQQR